MSELCTHGKLMFSGECADCATAAVDTFKAGDIVEGTFTGSVVATPDGYRLQLRLVDMRISVVNGRSLLKKDGGL